MVIYGLAPGAHGVASRSLRFGVSLVARGFMEPGGSGIAEVLIFLRHSSRVWTAECPPRASWLRRIFRLLLLWAVGWRM